MRAGGWGVAGRSYYRWREEYGGLKMDQDRQMKELERGERPAVKQLVVDLSLDKAILTEAAPGTPPTTNATPASRISASQCWISCAATYLKTGALGATRSRITFVS